MAEEKRDQPTDDAAPTNPSRREVLVNTTIGTVVGVAALSTQVAVAEEDAASFELVLLYSDGSMYVVDRQNVDSPVIEKVQPALYEDKKKTKPINDGTDMSATTPQIWPRKR